MSQQFKSSIDALSMTEPSVFLEEYCDAFIIIFVTTVIYILQQICILTNLGLIISLPP